MDCFLDFCLACDKQTTDGFYCSQACRLADMERAGPTATPSPSACSFDQISWSSPQLDLSSGFHLPPAVNFSSRKALTCTSTESRSEKAHQTTQPHESSYQSMPSPRGLSPSSSRSSLSSASASSSSQTNATISEQARHELRDYFSAFDQTRDMKRRSLSSATSH